MWPDQSSYAHLLHLSMYPSHEEYLPLPGSIHASFRWHQVHICDQSMLHVRISTAAQTPLNLQAAKLTHFVWMHPCGPSDSLMALALRYGCDVATLRRINNLPLSELSVQSRARIYIPGAPHASADCTDHCQMVIMGDVSSFGLHVADRAVPNCNSALGLS